MKRKEFLKNVLSGGCACTLLTLGGGKVLSADDTPEKKPEKDKNQEFITNWTENLMVIMDQNLDEKTREKIMQASGRKCAQNNFNPVALKYKGKVKELLSYLKQNFADFADYDEKNETIRMVSKKFKSCFCPLVKGRSSLKSPTYCLCSRGWMKEVFETVTGKKVEVELEQTILRGADCCSFKMTLT
jgi:predicted hydrocarbon binding protein